VTVFSFAITQSGYQQIDIEADDGFFIDDWRDLSAPSCLLVPAGGFRIEETRAVFSSEGVVIFVLQGRPFEIDPGHSGQATIETADTYCPNVGWRWQLMSKR
jgi:hypothetical protein